MDMKEIKVQIIGNYLRPLAEPLSKYGITFGKVGSVIEGCSILAMEDEPNYEIQKKYIFSSPFDKHIFTIGCLMNLQKNLSARLSRNAKIYNQCFSFDAHNKSERICNDSDYVIIYNASMGSSLFEKNGYVFSDIWPLNRFINDLKSDSEYRRHDFPFAGVFNWRFYFDKFIGAVMSEYDSDHIILIRLNAAQWFLNDNEITAHDEQSAQWRNRIEEMDNYFAEKTNCLIVDELYNHIPLAKLPCSFLYAHPSQINYSDLAKAIYREIHSNGDERHAVCRMANPFARLLLSKLSKDILKENQDEIAHIENKWLSPRKIREGYLSNGNEFFNNLECLNKFLDVDNGYTLSDYVITLLQNKADLTRLVDLGLVELYTRYMKLNINDIIAVYMLYSENEDKSAFKKIVENIMNNSDCLPVKKALDLANENRAVLKDYPYIQTELRDAALNSKCYINIGNNLYIVLDLNSQDIIEKVEIGTNENFDLNKIFKDGITCDILLADALCQNTDFYIERSRRGLANKPVVIYFESNEDFGDSLCYINYADILTSERFVIKLSGSPFLTEIVDYNPIVNIDNMIAHSVDIPLPYMDERIIKRVNDTQALDQLYKIIDNQDENYIKKVSLSEKLIYGLRHNRKLIKDRCFGKSISAVLSGFEIAERMLCSDDGTHYFIKNAHLGDHVRSGMLITLFRDFHIKNKTFPVRKIVVLTQPNYIELFKAYRGIDEVLPMTNEELADLSVYSESGICVHNIYSDTFRIAKKWGSPDLCSIYKIPDEYLYGNPEIMRFPRTMTDRSMENAEKTFEKNSADPEKTVIIMPYAQTTGNIDHDMFKGIIAYFNKIGYKVFTNAGLGEEVMEGTVQLSETADVVFSMAAKGAIMIGVQSGIMDALEWLNINIKFIFLSILNARQNVFSFFNANKFVISPPAPHDLSRRIERRKGAVSLAIASEQDRISFTDDLIYQSKIYIKGNIQNSTPQSMNEAPIYAKTNLNEYIEEAVKLPNLVIFISVCDSADRYWNRFENRYLLDLKKNLSTKWRMSYLAVIDKGNDVCSELLTDKWSGVEFSYSFSDSDKSAANIYGNEVLARYGEIPAENHCWLYSCAMDKCHYTRSSIVINGIDYSQNERGLNIVLYSKDKAMVIDSINVDTFGDEKLTVRRLANTSKERKQ